MSTKVGLISDVHASASPLKQALQIFRENGVDKVLCSGDIAGYGNELNATIELLIENQCFAIAGNHDIWFLQSDAAKKNMKSSDYLRALPSYAVFNIESKKVYMVHAYPPNFNRGGIKLLDIDGHVCPKQKEFWIEKLADYSFDILIVGHTHQVFAEKLGHILVINPGSTCFNHSCAILKLPEMSVDFISLPGKPYSKIWNWGTFLTE